MNVHRHPGITQQDLARRLLVGRSNVTMLLPELERRKLLKRSADMKDKRVLRLSLTDEGRDLLGKALPIYAGLIEQVMSQSSDAECELIGKTMDRITAMLEGNGV
jgi:DNA-binding MarR family transcriptional regulator